MMMQCQTQQQPQLQSIPLVPVACTPVLLNHHIWASASYSIPSEDLKCAHQHMCKACVYKPILPSFDEILGIQLGWVSAG
eukprot:NODE_5848_length_547_cov_77.216867_g5104_i0.p1 GENE.NODE_5848_length_547_cov_77.216867_g5104_i0~~NODE_5848_length_547_cov_77.216867_g5104_i0.p1  ORF type:complete len:80 (+),score=9.30 NODE_5848_length_547_cov_77.216867_g5104_i0:244-483(+)